MNIDSKDTPLVLLCPAWKKWVTADFGIDEKLVDGLWKEVARIEGEVNQHEISRYGP